MCWRLNYFDVRAYLKYSIAQGSQIWCITSGEDGVQIPNIGNHDLYVDIWPHSFSVAYTLGPIA